MTQLKQAWNLLPNKFKVQSFVVLFLTLIGTFFETLSIGLIIPAISIIVDPNFPSKESFFFPLFQYIGSSSREQMLTYGVLGLFGIFVFKNAFLAYLGWVQAQFIFGMKAYFSSALFEKYLTAPYEFHLQNNSGLLIRNLTIEVQQLVTHFLKPVIILITEFTVVIGIAALLFYFEPVSAAILFFITGFAIFIFQLITKRRLEKWGKKRQFHEGLKIQKAQEGFGGAKEIKLFGREDIIIRAFEKNNLSSSLFQRRQYALAQIPKLWIELLGVLSMILLILLTVRTSGNASEIVPVLGLFAASAFKILPSANRILTSTQALRYSKVAVDLIFGEFKRSYSDQKQEQQKLVFIKSLELNNVSYNYPDAETPSIVSVNLKIKNGATIGIYGTTGAGKSTLINLILGLIKPSTGSILVDGKEIHIGLRSYQELIGYVPQHIFLTDDTLRQNIAFGLKARDISDEKILAAVEQAQLSEFIEGLPNGFNTIVGERGIRLSGGQIQRIGIARALYNKPSILIFDEATSALDNQTELDVMKSIYSLKKTKTVIIVAHRMTTLQKCDTLYEIKFGTLVPSKLHFDIK